MSDKKIAITIGDPAGIGPEIIIRALNDISYDNQEFVLIGNKTIFSLVSQRINLPLKNVEFIHIPCDISKINIGEPSEESGKLSFFALERACELAIKGEIGAIVTAPLSKKAINMAGYHYSGQTEVLQKYLGQGCKAEMLFVAGDFKVMLLTRHVKVGDIAGLLSIEGIVESVSILAESLKNDFKIKNPKIAICGLNPHAGEEGLLGNEENNVIIPAMEILKQEFGIKIYGPFPADTLFVKAGKACFTHEVQPYNAYVACYHDQGLIPMKLLAMDKSVNMTINLPVIRTSPAHGTAYDIADQYIADYSSMKHAIEIAIQLNKE